jgi:YD repeat-containing protein
VIQHFLHRPQRYLESGNGTEKDYIFDATNRLVKASNETGEQREYFYNGLGSWLKTIWLNKGK